MRMLLAAVLLFALPAAARAHDIWLSVGADGRAIVNYGHPGDRLPPDPEKLADLEILRAGGSTSLLKTLARGAVGAIPVVFTEPVGDGGFILAARYDNGYWVETAEGYRNVSKRVVPTATRSLWSMKLAKTLIAEGAA